MPPNKTGKCYELMYQEQETLDKSSILEKLSRNFHLYLIDTFERTKQQPQLTAMNLNVKLRFCLAVILTLHVTLIQNTKAQHQELNHQLVHHSQQSHSQNAFFKDLAGPTSGKIQTLDVICGKNFMTVRAEFSGPFYGIVFSKGTYGQENCIYVKPNSGLTHAAFNVYYDQCGTKPDLQGKFYENTIVIQYGSDIIEAYDEAKRLRCEWFEAYEKPATFKPAIPVADLEVVEMNFQGDDIDCWMEIQEGSGPWSREVSKIVPVGQPMTIVVAINDYNGQFDMRVKSCVAHDGIQQPISLTDEFGCVLRPKMLTPFAKIKNPGGHKKATVLSYSRFLAFKFPDSMTVQIQCTVEVCRHGCADACQRIPSTAATTLQPELSLTARWPSAPNQPALVEGPAASQQSQSRVSQSIAQRVSTVDSQQYKPARMQFTGQNQRLPQGDIDYNNNRGHSKHVEAILPSGEDMSSSDSELYQATNMAVNNRQNPGQQQKRLNPQNLEDAAPPFLIDLLNRTQVATGSHYIVPHTNRRGASSPFQRNQPISPSSTTTTTSIPPTTLSTLEPIRIDESAEVSDEQTPVINRDSSAKAETVVNKEANQQVAPSLETSTNSDSSVDNQRQQQQSTDNKPEASEVKPVVLGSDQDSSDSKPSVQSDQQEQDNSNKPQEANSDKAAESLSSLKTVEVEIPANEESAQSPTENQFNSVRLPNVDVVGSNNFNYNQRESNHQQKNYLRPSSVHSNSGSASIIERRDRGEESNIEAAIAANSKGRFGARSQPQSNVQSAVVDHSPVHYNHQMPASDSVSVDHQDSASGGASNTKESIQNSEDSLKVLIDRSDDSPLIEVSPSGSSTSNQQTGEQSSVDKNNDVVLDAASSNIDEIAAPAESGATGSKVKPVVGTEELASGPIQIEDRIGAQPDTLEEALARLQQKLPQQAALVSANSQQQESLSSVKQQPSSAQQSVDQNVSKSPEKLEQKVDANKLEERADREQVVKQVENHKLSAQQELNQPYPNIAGQAKVMPDPNSNVNQRNPILVQASSDSAAVAYLVPPPSSQQSQQQPTSINKQQNEPKPVAQITNVPINIGFSQSQIPAIQQLSQQLAYLQKQQQQQQQLVQQPQPTNKPTSKPLRSRFNLFSPQAALQAVASRFLPSKLGPQQQQQQQQQEQQNSQQQMPNLLKLSPEQQKLLTLTALQHPGQKYFLSKPTQPQHYQQQVPNRFSALPQSMQQTQTQAQYQQPQPQPQPTSAAAGLFGRFNSPHQQPLIRSRRSAIMPNGKRGNGEVGMTKTFMVVTGLDLAFLPNSTETELPPILEGRRLVDRTGREDDVIYGVCMPVVSLTFVLTCAFWLIVFVFSFCVYMLIKSRKQHQLLNNIEK